MFLPGKTEELEVAGVKKIGVALKSSASRSLRRCWRGQRGEKWTLQEKNRKKPRKTMRFPR